MSVPRIAAIHDLSCFGRCSLTIAVPVLSAMGCQCCPLPTALLSAHTGFSGSSFLDLTEEMNDILDHWSALDLHFDVIYSGFLGSAAQAETVAHFIHRFKAPGTRVILDPVMGDHGTAYRTCTPELCRRLCALTELADVITPNLTEAALLLDRPYEDVCRMDPSAVTEALSLNGRRSVVLTGYSAGPGQTGALCFDRETGRMDAVQTQREPRDFSGTGDLFASVLTGGLARGLSLTEAARAAAEFVRAGVARSIAAGLTDGNGVEFEPLLGRLSAQA